MPSGVKKKRPAKGTKTKARRLGGGRVFRQQGAVRARGSKAQLRHVKWKDVELERLNPLLCRQFVVGHDIMVARVLLRNGAVVPEHSHVNEQVTYILEGALKFWIDGKEVVVKAGEVLTIPPNMPHKAKAMMDTVDLDVFSPPRADWINKDDSYLRGARK